MNVALTREQVRRVDRTAIADFGVAGLVLMENAGRNAGSIILDWMTDRGGSGSSKAVRRIVVFCGTGNNAGDGLVIARHLVNAGKDVRIALAGDPERLTSDAAANHRICAAMKIPMTDALTCELSHDVLVVDALLGTGFTGQVREPPARVIDRINAAETAGVIAIDVPSGLDCDSGMPSNATIIADVTITFVANKVGYLQPEAQRYIGRVHVVDIGAPVGIVESILSS